MIWIERDLEDMVIGRASTREVCISPGNERIAVFRTTIAE